MFNSSFLGSLLLNVAVRCWSTFSKAIIKTNVAHSVVCCYQPVDIKTRWRHNWKSARVVNSHLVCDPTIRQPGFDLPRQQWSLLNRFRMEQGHCGACRRKWRLTLICVLVARPRRCLTLSNPVPWQNWMAAYLGYTLRKRTLFRGWLIMVNDTHMRRRRSVTS